MLTAGFRKLARNSGLIALLFLLNLTFGFLASRSPRAAFGKLLDHSLFAQNLTERFDIAAFFEVIGAREMPTDALIAGSVALTITYLLLTLFLTGGIVARLVGREPLKLRGLLSNSAEFFWRMVRLALLSLPVLGLLTLLLSGVNKWSDTLSSDHPNARLGFFVLAGFAVVVLFLLSWARAWFDLAQTRAVTHAENLHMFRNTWASFRQVARTPRLAISYFCILVIAAAVLAGGVWLASALPSKASLISWLILEVVTLAWIAGRLWQRAVCAAWSESHRETVAVEPAAEPAVLDIPEPSETPA